MVHIQPHMEGHRVSMQVFYNGIQPNYIVNGNCQRRLLRIIIGLIYIDYL